MPMRIGVILGTRPEIIKNYSVIKTLRAAGATVYVLYTNQHGQYQMSDIFFEDLGYSYDFALEGVYALGKAIDWVRHIIRIYEIDLIVVNGDTAAALVGAIAAIYSDVRIAHIEAGLRSFDVEMYEERNRIMVDACSNYLFAYTNYEKEYLEKNPEIRGNIYCVGNTTLDLIEDFYYRIDRLVEGNYAYVTLHRKEFTDREDVMRSVFQTIGRLSEIFDAVIFPIHPRTKDAMERYKIPKSFLNDVTIINPVSIFESLSYAKFAAVILTDSGSIQEEAYIFGVPCVTIRNNTERHLTVINGANIVSGFARQDILDAVGKHLSNHNTGFPSIYGKYGAGQRITDILLNARVGMVSRTPFEIKSDKNMHRIYTVHGREYFGITQKEHFKKCP